MKIMNFGWTGGLHRRQKGGLHKSLKGGPAACRKRQHAGPP